MKLSILIPTITERKGSARKLYNKLVSLVKPHTAFLGEKPWLNLYGFKNSEVEVVFIEDNKEMTIGEKREMLYKRAEGEYSWSIDDDDTISDNAIDIILESINQYPDCITFQEHCTINGQLFSSNHSLKYEDWGEKQDGFDYVRTPFMKSVIKTEIARSVPIPHIRYGEDHEWAKVLKPHLKTEVHIPEYIYYYQHESKPEDHNTRYGLDK